MCISKPILLPIFLYVLFPSIALVKFPPNIVNIHVKHPPEASVQIHQVSRIDSTSTGQKAKVPQPVHPQVSYQGLPYQKTQKGHATYTNQQPIPHMFPVSVKTQLGRCFQETVGTQVRNVY